MQQTQKDNQNMQEFFFLRANKKIRQDVETRRNISFAPPATYVCPILSFDYRCPLTEYFTILVPRNLSIDVSVLHKNRGSTDYGPLKLRSVWSGHTDPKANFTILKNCCQLSQPDQTFHIIKSLKNRRF